MIDTITVATINACIHAREDGYSSRFDVYLNDERLEPSVSSRAAAAALVEQEIAKRVRNGRMTEYYDLRYSWHYSETMDG